MPEQYYLHKLYPFQDEILRKIQGFNVGFYLSGGTALSRCYLDHRYSDDLDLFLNNAPDFKQQCGRVIANFGKTPFHLNIAIKGESFLRVFISKEQLVLKMDFINDVPCHFGEIQRCTIFNHVDNWRNILSNKICALTRMEPKDYADILFIAKQYLFNWKDLIEEAKNKDLWVDPIEVSRMIKEFPTDLLSVLKWTVPPDLNQAEQLFSVISKEVLMGENNSLVSGNGQ